MSSHILLPCTAPSNTNSRTASHPSAPNRRLRIVRALIRPAMSSSDNVPRGPIRSVAVVGGGVSGLAAAYKLKSNGVKVTVFEANERAGGKIRSNCESGLIWDEGANTMTESESDVGKLLDDLGLRDKQQFPISQDKRYVVRNGKPVLIPSNPIALIKSNILSAQSKLKLFMEPLLVKHSGTKSSTQVSDEFLYESVGKFFERHFGKEVVDYLVDPFVAGTSGGDPESLSMRHAFPELWDLERKFGSIFIGAICSKVTSKNKDNKVGNSSVKKRNKRASFSFYGGMQALTDSLCNEVGSDNLKLNSKVLSLSYDYDRGSPFNGWAISFSAHDRKNKEVAKNQSFDAVIMTAPLSNVQEMNFRKSGSPFVLDFLPKNYRAFDLRPWTRPPFSIRFQLTFFKDVTTLNILWTFNPLPEPKKRILMPNMVNYLPLSVIITSFKKENVRRPLEGFGVLVPSKEQENGLKTLGTLFSSMMFPERAPKDQYLYTTFIGGSRNRDLAGAPLDMLKQIVTSDLKKLLDAEGQPTFVKHVYWKNAFPLYGHDYDLVLKAIEKMEKNLPGFFYAGNHKDGLSVGKSITSGCKAAEDVISYLGSCIEQDA